ncbi:unnamed protein product [Victoria cruziana]
MECYTGIDNASASVSQLLLKAAFSITPSQWLLSFLSAFAVFLYNFLEIHLIGDLLRGMRGDPVSLIYNPNSDFCSVLIAKCPTLRGRYLPTPWLPSPHLQTGFLQFFGRPPAFQYWRQIFHVPDGGTIALDWLSSNASRNHILNKTLIENDPVPIVVVVPGLTSDSASSYIRHIVHQLSKQGWDVVVSNHRGLGGISITSSTSQIGSECVGLFILTLCYMINRTPSSIANKIPIQIRYLVLPVLYDTHPYYTICTVVF